MLHVYVAIGFEDLVINNWLIITLVSACSLAAADAGTRRYFSNHDPLTLLLVRFTLPGLLLLPWALNIPFSQLPATFYVLMAMLVVLELSAMYLYVLAIQHSPLHLTLPYLAFTPVFIIVTGYVFLGETITLPGLCGISLVVAGAYWLNLSAATANNRSGRLTLRAALRALRTGVVRARGSRFMLGAAFIYSITAVFSKHAMLYTDPVHFGPFYFASLGAAAAVVLLLGKPSAIRQLKRHYWAALFVAFFMSAMVVSHFIAIAQVEVAYMITVKRTSLLFGIVIGALWLKEHHLMKNVFAGMVMIFGVVLITL